MQKRIHYNSRINTAFQKPSTLINTESKTEVNASGTPYKLPIIATDRHEQKIQKSTNFIYTMHKAMGIFSKSITGLKKIIHGIKHSHKDM